MEYFHGRMEKNMKAIGRMGNKMEMEELFT